MMRIAILGSTGSIGESTLQVIRRFPDQFKVTRLSTNSNIGSLHKQIREFKPTAVCVRDLRAAQELKRKAPAGVKVYSGEEAHASFAIDRSVDKIVLAVSGSGALTPLFNAVEAGKTIALANKEALVMAGPLIMRIAKKSGAQLLPIDSEQSAIWQCLDGQNKAALKQIYLTASGGPLRGLALKDLKKVTIRRVLRHPRWKMGKKITVDSATLMNKGLEVLEGMFLFGISADKIKTVVHPEAIIHSMVEFIDGVILAQLSVTDMRVPIQYALSYPARLKNSSGQWLDFFRLKSLNFEKPDLKKFPCLALAYRAARELGTAPAVVNAANEVCVDAFLEEKIAFEEIAVTIERVLNRHSNCLRPTLGDILYADIWARQHAGAIIRGRN
jgi:1-deoxy-D-xylulose-5-phosphate reductoisomerase